MPVDIIKIKRSKDRSILPLDLVPLIDIVFLLLIFFMLTATFTTQPGIKINLPEASAPEADSTRRLTVYLTADNTLYLNQEKIALDKLKEALIPLTSTQKRDTLTIRADETALHGTVVKIMDIATDAGIDKLLIGVDKEN